MMRDIVKMFNLNSNYYYGEILFNGSFLPIICLTYIISVLICITWKCKLYVAKANALKALNAAVTKGEILKCIKIIEKYPSLVNAVEHGTGYTPFLKACLFGNTQLVRYMLQKGANISLTTNRRESAFYLAAYNRICNRQSSDASCLHALYHAGANIDLPNERGFTPLQMAAMFGHTALVKWLLSKKADNTVFPNPILLARWQGSYFLGHHRTANALNVTVKLRAILQK